MDKLTPEQVKGLSDHERERQKIIEMLKEKYSVKPIKKPKK